MNLRRLFLLGLTVALFACTTQAEDKKPATLGTIKRSDKRFDKLVPADAIIERLTPDDYAWTEGPVWNAEGKFLLFSDIPNNRIVKWQEGKTSDFIKPSGYTGDRTDLKEPGTNGLAFDSEGRLIGCAHGDQQLVRFDKDGKKRTVLADKFEGKKLNSPNDLTFMSNGDIYFTDPPYGRMVKGKVGFPDRDLDFCGVYRLSKDGKLTLLTKEMSKPNGIALSPDEKTLYVANSDPEKAVWMAFPVKADGTLGEGKLFADVTKLVGKDNPGLPDGMKVDNSGNVWATGPGGVFVFAPDGTQLGLLATGVPTANCAWGEDGSVLYITADKAICRVKTSSKGSVGSTKK